MVKSSLLFTRAASQKLAKHISTVRNKLYTILFFLIFTMDDTACMTGSLPNNIRIWTLVGIKKEKKNPEGLGKSFNAAGRCPSKIHRLPFDRIFQRVFFFGPLTDESFHLPLDEENRFSWIIISCSANRCWRNLLTHGFSGLSVLQIRVV